MSGGEKARQQEAAIAALLSCPTIEEAAQKAGIGNATLRRWLQQPKFKSEFRAARRHVVDGAVTRLQQVTTEAVDALQRNLTCGLPPSEIAAARAVLDQAIKAIELVDMAERLEALEQQAASQERKEG